MLTNFWIRDELTASLGNTNNHFIVYVSGETTRSREQIRQFIAQGMKEFNSRESVVLRLLVPLVGV